MITLPSGIVLQTLIEDLRTISWDAADILLNYSSLITDPKYKTELIKNQNNYDPVTKADLEVNEIIIKKINEKYKNVNWGILSEENAKLDSFAKIENKDWLWVLDPLDGTRDFIQGSGNYAMHLALNYKNKPFIGVVLIPEKNELWISDGSKVWSETREGEINNIEIKKKSCLKEELIYNNNKFEQRGLIVATNGKETHKEICDEIAKIIKKFDILPSG